MFEHTKNIDIHSNKHSASKQVLFHAVCDIHIYKQFF